MTARGELEHLARALLEAHTGETLSVSSELTREQRARLDQYRTRADLALGDVRCELLGRECTCWTIGDLVVADVRRQAVEVGS